jgi:hypothetical protein
MHTFVAEYDELRGKIDAILSRMREIRAIDAAFFQDHAAHDTLKKLEALKTRLKHYIEPHIWRIEMYRRLQAEAALQKSRRRSHSRRRSRKKGSTPHSEVIDLTGENS